MIREIDTLQVPTGKTFRVMTFLPLPVGHICVNKATGWDQKETEEEATLELEKEIILRVVTQIQKDKYVCIHLYVDISCLIW